MCTRGGTESRHPGEWQEQIVHWKGAKEGARYQCYWSWVKREVDRTVESPGEEEGHGERRILTSLLSSSKGDFVDPCLGDLIMVLKLPSWLKRLLSFLMKPLVRVPGLQGRSLGAPSYDSSWPLASRSAQAWLPHLLTRLLSAPFFFFFF